MIRTSGRLSLACVLQFVFVFSVATAATVEGVAPNIPEPEHRNVIVQLFNWRFQEIERVLPRLKAYGYSHIHVSPPQRSNDAIWQWWGRYQPIDFSTIAGPLGNEQVFRQMN